MRNESASDRVRNSPTYRSRSGKAILGKAILNPLFAPRARAAILAIIAACMFTSTRSPKTTGTGFCFFVAAWINWLNDGWLEIKASVEIQNVALRGVNVFGIWLWHPKVADNGPA